MTLAARLGRLGRSRLGWLAGAEHKTEKGIYSVSKMAGTAHDEGPTEFCEARSRYWLRALLAARYLRHLSTDDDRKTRVFHWSAAGPENPVWRFQELVLDTQAGSDRKVKCMYALHITPGLVVHALLGPPAEGRGGPYSHEHCFFLSRLFRFRVHFSPNERIETKFGTRKLGTICTSGSKKFSNWMLTSRLTSFQRLAHA